MVNGAENAKLVQSLNITDLPRLVLYPKGSNVYIEFPTGVYINGINTRRFASKYTGTLYITPSSFLDFDKRALQFVKATKAEQEVLLKEAEEKIKAEVPDNANEKTKKLADTYLKTMQKIIEKGKTYVTEEMSRLDSLLQGREQSSKKSLEFNERKNVLYHFDFDIDLLFQVDNYDSSMGIGGVHPHPDLWKWWVCGGGGLDSLGAVALREEEPIIVEILNDYRGEGDGSQEYLMNCREIYLDGEHVYK